MQNIARNNIEIIKRKERFITAAIRIISLIVGAAIIMLILNLI